MKIARFFALIAMVAMAFAFSGAKGVSAQSNTYSTGFQIQNLSGTTANVTISFYKEGTASAAASVTDTIPANGSKTFATLPSAVPAGFNGGAVISSDQKVAATVNVIANGNFSYGASYSGFSAGSKAVSTPLLFKGSFGFNTFFNVQNTGSAEANVTITYSGGGLGTSLVRTAKIQPGSATRFDQGAEAGLPNGFNGSATITSDQDVAVAVVQAGPTTLLSYNGFNSASTAPVMPLVNANNAGFITGISMQNAGDAATEVTVAYTPSGAGNGTACTEKQTIQPKSTAFYALYSISAGGAAPAGIETNCARGTKFVGSAKVTVNSANQPLVAVVNQLNNATKKAGSYGSFNPANATQTVIFPIIQDRFFGYFTGFSISNVGTAATNVTCSFSGSAVQQKAPAALNPGETFTIVQQGAIGANYNGSAVCSGDAGAKLVGVLNQVNPGAATDAFFVSEGTNS